MKSAIVLSLTLLASLTAAVPTSASSPSIPSGDVNYSTFKIPKCAADGESHIESHGQTPNGGCMSWDWLRSIAYKADFPHSYCDVKFFSDGACSADKEVAAPGTYTSVLIDNYFPGCWDDLTARGGGVTVEEGWVVMPSVNMTVTCT